MQPAPKLPYVVLSDTDDEDGLPATLFPPRQGPSPRPPLVSTTPRALAPPIKAPHPAPIARVCALPRVSDSENNLLTSPVKRVPSTSTLPQLAIGPASPPSEGLDVAVSLHDSEKEAKENEGRVLERQVVECLCLSSDSESDVEVLVRAKGKGREIATPRPRATPLTPQPRQRPPWIVLDDSEDSDSEDMARGILRYEPTPRGRKPTPLKRSTNLDLTLSSSPSSSSSSSSDDQPKPARPRPKPARVPPLSDLAAPVRASPLLTKHQRDTLPLLWIRELDRTVFRTYGGLPEGLNVVWSNRLLNTAGRASFSKGVATIELAVKVCDTEDRLRQTLAHECCHVAAWVLSKEMKPPHGSAFKLWAKRIMEKHDGILVTTTHSYAIAYKYRWICMACSKIFSRHSNSIDTKTHGCSCGGTLTRVDKDGTVRSPAPHSTTSAVSGGTPNPYLMFIAEMTPVVRLEQPGLKQSEVIRIVAGLWRARKTQLEDQVLERGLQGLHV